MKPPPARSISIARKTPPRAPRQRLPISARRRPQRARARRAGRRRGHDRRGARAPRRGAERNRRKRSKACWHDLDEATNGLDPGGGRVSGGAALARRNVLGVAADRRRDAGAWAAWARRPSCCARRRPMPKRSAAPMRRSPRTRLCWSIPPIALKRVIAANCAPCWRRNARGLAQYDRLTIMRINVRRPQEPIDPVLEMPAAPARGYQSAVRKRAHDAGAHGTKSSREALDSALRSAGSGGAAARLADHRGGARGRRRS